MSGYGRHSIAARLMIALLPLFFVLAAVPLALAEATAPLHGLAPLPNDEKVPPKLLPPGTSQPDMGPSDVIFPTQHLMVRFNHAKHMTKDIGATCKTCHGAALKSTSVTDSLIPTGEVCDACHSTDHTNLGKVAPGDEAMGQCGFCHLGYKPSDQNTVAETRLPRANLFF